MRSIDLYNAICAVDDDILERSEAAIGGRRKSGWRKWGVLAACFGLMVTAAVAALPGLLNGPGGVVPPPNPGPVFSDGDKLSGTDPLPPPNGQSIVINWDNVTVNESAGLAPDYALRYYDPALYDRASWGEEEVSAYYGWNLTPAYLPDGLTGGGTAAAGSIVREKSAGEIVQDQAGRGFWTDFWEDGSPKSEDDIVIPTGFTITASRSGILHCGLLPVDEARTTDFGGVSVTLSHCSMKHGPFDPTQKAPDGLSNMPAGYYDIYTASFTLDGVEYEITAQRLELEEVIQITASVINRPYREDFVVGNPLPASSNEEETPNSTPAVPDMEDGFDHSMTGQSGSVGEPQYEDSEPRREGCYDDPNNPAAEQNYRVGKPRYE